MKIQVTTRRQDNVSPEEVEQAFAALGWTYGGKGGLANYTHLFSWQNSTAPIYPNGFPYEVSEINTSADT